MRRSTIEQSRVVPGQVPAVSAPVARPAVEPVRSRRRPLLAGLGVALAALGGLGAAWLASSGTGTVTVVGIRHEVRAGAAITKNDLVSVEVATGTPLRTLPIGRYEEVVGKRTLVRLLPGSLLNPAAVADRLVPGAGQALVGLNLGAAQRPAVRLDAGDPVEILVAAAAGSDTTPGTAGPTPSPVLGTVVSTEEDPDNGKTVVNVTVPTSSAAKVATWGSSGRATIVLLPAGQG